MGTQTNLYAEEFFEQHVNDLGLHARYHTSEFSQYKIMNFFIVTLEITILRISAQL